MMDKKNLTRHELIGLGATIVESMNKSLIGISGRVVDETRNTLTIDGGDHMTKKLLKGQVTLRFKYDHDEEVVDGKTLVGRPEDRLKKIRR